MQDDDRPYGRGFEEENRAYCDEIQRRLLEYEMDPRNFLRLQRRMLGVKNIAPVALASAGGQRG